jgi:tetratricopeptide (TPR) repeat protein
MKGYTLRALRRYEEALAAYEEAIRLKHASISNYASIWEKIGDVLTALERPHEAQQAYEQARQLDSGEKG